MGHLIPNWGKDCPTFDMDFLQVDSKADELVIK